MHEDLILERVVNLHIVHVNIIIFNRYYSKFKQITSAPPPLWIIYMIQVIKRLAMIIRKIMQAQLIHNSRYNSPSKTIMNDRSHLTVTIVCRSD